MHRLVLSQDELKRRIDAARTLRGLTQNQLADRLAEDGLGKHDLGRIERGDPRLPFKAIHRRALAHHLRVPESWFTDPELEFPGPSAGTGQLDRIEAMLQRLIDALTRPGQDEEEFETPTVPPELRDALTRQPADQQPAADTPQTRRSQGQGA